MKHIFIVLTGLLLMAQSAFGQTFAIKGKLTDRKSGEALPGGTVQVQGNGVNTGGVSEVNGSFKVDKLTPGTYTVTASYIGYVNATQTVVVKDRDVTISFQVAEDNATLNEVEIVADVAVERETPVAFSAIKESTIRESLAGRDLPMILNETPGVYATEQGGGPGESRISIRGFSQENIAVMVNGVPVNDMENGRVFWANWDLGDVTKSTQVQRGLSASKLATPSIGGTMNILTKGFEKKESFIARQEIGSNNYNKTSLMYSSGQLKGDWAFTVYGSRRQGDGWVKGVFDDSWSYFANISKRFGNHTLSLTGLGSPQIHGRRAFARPINVFDSEKAIELGATPLKDANGQVKEANGFDYNPHYQAYDRYLIMGSDTIHNYQTLTDQQNFYHKPQFNLNHFWTVSDRLFISNVVYMSIGKGGSIVPLTGSPINPQGIYNSNYGDRNKPAGNYMRTQNNEHQWYGFISGLDYKLTDALTLSAGIDGRSYTGQHFSKIYDLMGGEFTTHAGNKNVDPTTKLKVGDKIAFDNDGYVRYAGGFLMAEYKSNVISAFISGTLSRTSYKRKDYFLAKRYKVEVTNQNGETVIEEIPLDFNNGTLVPNAIADRPLYNLILLPNTPATYNNLTYNRIDSEGELQESDWVNFNNYTIKGGINYNLNEFNNIFVNVGYLNKAPFFNNVFNTTTGTQYADVRNESVASFEIGYGINRGNFKANLNAYNTYWFDRSQSRTVNDQASGEEYQYVLVGLDARHTGVELELAQELSRKVELNAAISIGDWRWNSAGVARITTSDGVFVSEDPFNAAGVHVGNSAQNQFMIGVRVEPVKGLYFRPTLLMFSKNYSNFDPQTLSATETPQDSYRLPSSRSLDIHSGYSFKFYKDLSLRINGSVLNVLDEYFITDVPVRVGTGTIQSDPNLIEVFFNRGRTFTLGASVAF